MWTITIVGILSSDHVSVCHSLQWMDYVDLHDNGEWQFIVIVSQKFCSVPFGQVTEPVKSEVISHRN